MRRASEIRLAGQWPLETAFDRVVLDSGERHCRRLVLATEGGASFLLDLPRATILRDGDGLVLDDGTIVKVAGKPEPLLEVTAASAQELVRIAWHIGNRHMDLQIVARGLRIRRDHVLEEMLSALGARLLPIEAMFEPESGAYAHDSGHGHRHGA